MKASQAVKGLEDRAAMAWQQVEVRFEDMKQEVEKFLRQGRLRQIVVKKDGQIAAQFPIAVGAIAAIAIPALSAIGAFVAVASGYSMSLRWQRKNTLKTRGLNRSHQQFPQQQTRGLVWTHHTIETSGFFFIRKNYEGSQIKNIIHKIPTIDFELRIFQNSTKYHILTCAANYLTAVVNA